MRQAMKAIVAVAIRELHEAVRNRWVMTSVVSLGGLAFILAVLGPAAGGASRAAALDIAVANVASLSTYLVPLLALLVAFDAIVGESERGTLALLLTHPLSRWQLLSGKFVAHVTVVLIAIGIGYGSVGVFVAWRADDVTGWTGYAAMMGASTLLGAAFVSLGFLVSVICKQRASAIGAVVALWLGLVVLYDLGLLSMLVVDENQAIGQQLFAALVLFNPGDAYRLFNLLTVDTLGTLTGMGPVVSQLELGRLAPILVLVAWCALPLAISAIVFQRKEL